MKKTSFIATSLTIATLAAMIPAAVFAQTVTTGVTVGTQGTITTSVPAVTTTASTGVTASTNSAGNTTTSGTGARFTANQQKADAAITGRISALNALSARLTQMKNLSSSEVSSLQTTLSAQVTAMNTLEAQINSDTTGATLKADASTIAKDYRIYMLILPQGRIAAASDRIDTIVGLMQGIAPKLEARITAAGNPSAAVSAYTDMNTQITNADTAASVALNETVTLQPDQGVTSVEASNDAALQDAKSKIQTAVTDLKAARTDINTIITAVGGNVEGHTIPNQPLSAGASVNTSASTGQ